MPVEPVHNCLKREAGMETRRARVTGDVLFRTAGGGGNIAELTREECKVRTLFRGQLDIPLCCRHAAETIYKAVRAIEEMPGPHIVSD